MAPTSWFGFLVGAPLANHLWQSTLFAMAVGLLSLALRANRAGMRHWLWLAASIKFLVPFSLLVGVGSRIEWRSLPAAGSPFPSVIEQIGRPFGIEPAAAAAENSARLAVTGPPALVAAIWLLGSTVVLWLWLARWRRIRRVVRAATRLPIQAPVVVMSVPALLEPGVFGIFRAVLLLPEGIAGRLTPAELRAILAHELCHVRRRDNLSSAIHMLVEAVFWFHPLVWWIGARMMAERERACDEEVVRLGNEPQAYAEGILKVCRIYLGSPLRCAAGVTGSRLKDRIEAILTHRGASELTPARKLLLVSAATTAIAAPILLGIVNAPASGAQSPVRLAALTQATGALTFEVASIKPADPGERSSHFRLVPGGGVNVMNMTLKQLITVAYQVRDFQISGGPGWLDSERYDIVAKPARPEGPADPRQATDEQRRLIQAQIAERLRALLAERFQLVVHRETKELPVYALVPAKNGARLQSASDASRQHIRNGSGLIEAEGSTIEMLTRTLSISLGRPVLDRTGLAGKYDFKIEWTPDVGPARPGPAGEPPEPSEAPDPAGKPSIFTAVQEQLGLRLVSQKGPVDMIVIDRAEKASAN